MFERSRRRILSILDDALLLTEIDVNGERFRAAQASLQSALTLAVEKTAAFGASRGVGIHFASEGTELVQADEDLLVRALSALLETAVRFSAEGETVRVAREAIPDAIGIVIESRGKTIPGAALPKFFDLFAIEEAGTPGEDLGLGPAVAYRILSLFGASVSVANRDESGTRVTISLR